MKRISNSIKKRVNALRRKKYRQKYKQYVIEGEKLCKEFINENFDQAFCLILRENTQDISQFSQQVDSYIADEKEFDRLSEFSSPDGFLLVAQMNEVEMPQRHFVLYLDSIRDPGNLGTILRTAHWFGVTDVYCSEDTVDVFNPKTVQASMGAVWHVNLHYYSWQNVRSIHSTHKVYKAEMKGINYSSVKLFRAPQKAILIMGNESNGSDITDNQLQNITIPQDPNSRTESLNVAMATGILVAGYFQIR